MTSTLHDPIQCVKQLRQTLAADKLAVGFFLGAGCPCAVQVPADKEGTYKPLIPDIKGLTYDVHQQMIASQDHSAAYNKLIGVLAEDGDASPTIETMLNRLRTMREVAGNGGVRGLSFAELDALDKMICVTIKQAVSCSLPNDATPYHALARFIGTQRYPLTEVFTTNYDVLMEQSLETCRVPFFDGFIGSSRPFFDQRAIEEDKIPIRWSRLWKLHGSINWRFNKASKSVFRSFDGSDGDELLIHPSHLKYDESRRMPYFVMIDRLRAFLKGNQKPVALFVIGYSFSDDHLNEAIVESLSANPSAACFALLYGNLANYPSAQKLARDNGNLSVLARDSAVIRRKEAKWVAHPATDFAEIRCAFQPIDASGADKKEFDESDQPQSCRLTLGDFKVLGEFLDEFYAFSAFSNMGTME